ncbi:MAG: thiamine-binding protein [Acidimicrobiales bacterium]
MIAEIQCLPTPAGTARDRYLHVDAAIAAIEATGLRHEVGPLGTSLEGPADAVWAAVRAAHEACMASGAEGVISLFMGAEAAVVEAGPGIDDLVAKFRS